MSLLCLKVLEWLYHFHTPFPIDQQINYYGTQKEQLVIFTSKVVAFWLSFGLITERDL